MGWMSHPARPSSASVIATLVVLLGLHGCATRPANGPDAAPAAPTSTAPAPAATRAASLGIERQWLQSWFDGTPVLIAQRGDGPVTLDVPREFCFDSARSTVKPALAAVLDKVAQSLRRRPEVRLQLLAAPADGAAASPLAMQRATQLRAHLVSRGVQPAQLGSPTATTAAAVQLRLEVAPL